HDYFTPESSNLRSNILPVVENSYYDNCYENSFKNNQHPNKQYFIPPNENHNSMNNSIELKESQLNQSSLNNTQPLFKNEIPFLLTQYQTPREITESKGHDSDNSTNEYFQNKNKTIENMEFNSITNKRPSFNDLSGHNLFINAGNSPTTQNKIDKNLKNESFQGDQNLKLEKDRGNKASENKRKGEVKMVK
ncbi:hypothetical protein DMUE_4924, partial [Dictyocoela muelleri]